MTQLTINTTQNVKINFEVASLFSRAMAFFIDMIIKFFYCVFLLYLWSEFNMAFWFNDQWSMVSFLVIIVSPAFFYSLIFETFMQGTTPGKKIMKIKVLKIDGYQASFVDFLIRWIFRLLDIMLGGGAIAIIFIAIGNKGQRLGDVVSGTAVISTKGSHKLASTIYHELEQEYKPVYTQVLLLSDNDIRIIKEVLENYKRTLDYKLLDVLAERVEKVLGVKQKTPSKLEFINTVLKDYNYLSLQA